MFVTEPCVKFGVVGELLESGVAVVNREDAGDRDSNNESYATIQTAIPFLI